jgi:uracil permease
MTQTRQSWSMRKAPLRTVPVPVLGGLSVVLFGMIASAGRRTSVEGQVDFKKSRNMIVVGLILVFGLRVTPGLVNIGDVPVSGLALAVVIGVAANLILPMDTEEVEVAMPSDTKS